MKAYPEELEANQEKTEAVTEQYEGVPHAEATHLLTTLQNWACNVLRGAPKGPMYEKI
jgi:hypothetical protein